MVCVITLHCTNYIMYIEVYSFVSFGSFITEEKLGDIELPDVVPASTATGRKLKTTFCELEVSMTSGCYKPYQVFIIIIIMLHRLYSLNPRSRSGNETIQMTSIATIIYNEVSQVWFITVKPVYSKHLGTQKIVLITEMSFYGHLYSNGTVTDCPDYRGVLIFECLHINRFHCNYNSTYTLIVPKSIYKYLNNRLGTYLQPQLKSDIDRESQILNFLTHLPNSLRQALLFYYTHYSLI